MFFFVCNILPGTNKNKITVSTKNTGSSTSKIQLTMALHYQIPQSQFSSLPAASHELKKLLLLNILRTVPIFRSFQLSINLKWIQNTSSANTHPSSWRLIVLACNRNMPWPFLWLLICNQDLFRKLHFLKPEKKEKKKPIRWWTWMTTEKGGGISSFRLPFVNVYRTYHQNHKP